MQLESAEFRRILGHWASGVAVVTTRTPAGRPCGLTANAVSSLSLDPPLVLTCIERSADTHDCIVTSGYFGVSILRADSERIARRFALGEIEEKFDGIAFREVITGAPILDDALAWIDCEVHAHHDGGDHTIFVGRVVAGDAQDLTPLVYYRSGYGGFAP